MILVTWKENGETRQEELIEGEATLRIWSLSKRSTVTDLRAWQEIEPAEPPERP